MSAARAYIIDVETDGLEPEYGCRPFLVGMARPDGSVLKVDCYNERGLASDVAGRGALSAVRRIVEDPSKVKAAHNAKFEIRMLRAMGWRPRGKWLCTMNLIVMWDEYSKLGLEKLALRFWGEKYEEYALLKAWMEAENRRRRKPWLESLRDSFRAMADERGLAPTKLQEYQDALKAGDGAPQEATYRDFYESNDMNADILSAYLEKDLDYCARLVYRFHHQVEASWAKPFKVETALVPVVARMEDAGITIGVSRTRQMRRKYRQARDKQRRRMFRLAGRKFNPNSPDQLLDVLWEQGVDVADTRKQTLGGLVSGGAEGGLRDTEPIVDALLEYRANTKVLQYFDSFLNKGVPAGDGLLRVHAKFWQNGQDEGIKTGRFSITDPGLQTIPGGYRGTVGERGKDVRRAIVPSGPGRSLLMLDYAQVEPRILAYYTRDPRLLQSLHSGEDIYLAFVRIFFGEGVFEGWTPADGKDAMSKMLKQRRSDAKTIILAIMYGMGVAKMAGQLGVPEPEARGMRAKCFRNMPTMRDLMNDSMREVRRRGHVEDMFGRWYRVPAGLAYKGINARIQGGAAGVMKRALVACDLEVRRWNRLNSRAPASMLLTVHDEIIFDAPSAYVRPLASRLKSAMETAAPEIDVPLVADVSYSEDSWGDKRDLDLPAAA